MAAIREEQQSNQVINRKSRGTTSFSTWHTGAFVAGVSLLDAGAPVMAGRRHAGQVAALAVLARVLG